jgi:hypothetical protein
MPKRLRTPADENELAAAIVARTTRASEKDPAAVALGRRGGLKGGHARAAALTPEERKQSAQDAANARWAKQKATKAAS